MQVCAQHSANRRQRGIAMVLVLTAIAFSSVIILEFSTNSNDDIYSAENTANGVQAHFLARSAVNLSHLLIRLQTDVLDRYKQQLGDFQITDYTDMFIGAFCGSKDEVDALASMVGGTAEDFKGAGLEVGKCAVTITSDDSKANLNCVNNQDDREMLQRKLEAMLYWPFYDSIFENPDAEGWRRDRETQVKAIIDYIDRDTWQYVDRKKSQSQGGPEEYGYGDLKDSYKPKNNYIDSVDELKLVRGVDDRLWSLLRKRVTVYGSCKQNIGAVRDPFTVMSIIILSAENESDPLLSAPTELWALARIVAVASSIGMFGTLQAFVEFVKNPDPEILLLLGIPGIDAASLQSGPPVQGIELDMRKLQRIAEEGARQTYRIEATADVGRVHRKITTVYDRKTQNQNARDPSERTGTWVYWKEE